MEANAVALPLSQHLNSNFADLLSHRNWLQYSAAMLTDEAFVLEKALTNLHGQAVAIETTKNETALELVCLANATLKDLVELTQTCQITLHAINAINTRLDITSVRFGVSCPNIGQARAIISEYAIAHNLEIALVENAPKLEQPGLLLMDMDSTTIEIECIDEIAALAGVGEEVAEVTELAMQGKLDFSQSLRERVGKLKGADESILASVANNLPLMPGLVELIEELKQHNWRIAIASGGFTYFADKLKSDLALDAARANVLEIVDGKLTGQVIGEIVDANVKAQTLNELAAEFKIASNQLVAMGDGANDLVMMKAASLGVAYKAKPVVLAQADTTICHSGLDCMIHWLA